MAPMILGLETEYGFAVLGRLTGLDDRDHILECLMSAARSKLCCLADLHSSGVFLANGSRLYIDTGGHPELATPECHTPFEVVRYVLAGDRILAMLAEDVETSTGTKGITLWRSNVDYMTSATWGTHENFLHRCDPESLRRPLAAFLASRLAFTGAGGFRPGSNGVEFVISPRVAFIARGAIDELIPSRPIIHDKDEPLAAGTHRLHLVCGESLCSELANVLKLGVTALVVAAIDAGTLGRDAPELEDPVGAMWHFAQDPTFRVTAELTDGRAMNALEIQLCYLEAIAPQVGKEWMPSWALAVCRLWVDVLEALAQGPEAVATRLDWAIKLALFRSHIEKYGFDEETLLAYSDAASMRGPGPARAMFRSSDFELLDRALRRAEIAARGAQQCSAQEVKAFLAERGLSLRGLSRFDRLRVELFEIDARFSQIAGGAGYFAELDAAGLLEHRIPEIGDVGAAVHEPPPGGRAERRSAYIRKLHGVRGATCTWDSIRERRGGMTVEMRDPFGVEVIEHEAPRRMRRTPPGQP